MADHYIALHYVHSVLAQGVVKLLLSNKFFSICYLCPSLVSRLLPLNDCVATKQKFCIVLQFFIFVQIPLFSFQLWALATKRTIVSRRE